MTPSVQHRLDSVVRALTDIILPALPPTANLANEQARLAIGHLMILKGQLPLAHAFEQEEDADSRALAEALLSEAQGGPATQGAAAALRQLLSSGAGAPEINTAVVALFNAGATDGEPSFRAQSVDIMIKHEAARAHKDRKWFAPMGFDAEIGA